MDVKKKKVSVNNSSNGQSIFLMMVRSKAGLEHARFLISNIRSFGDTMSKYPIWLFEANPEQVPCNAFEDIGVKVIPLNIPEAVKKYLFGDKVYACAKAEELAHENVNSLIWVDLDVLIVKPPTLYNLGASFDVAVKPVHIKNIGLLAEESLDSFWRKIYQIAGLDDIHSIVDSFVEGLHIRSYFNSAAYSVNPAKRLFRRWLDCFEVLISDKEFQANSCEDELHQVFLHQAIFSSLIVAMISPERIRFLPFEYNYPYNLQQSIPFKKKAQILNDLVTVVFEDRSMNPDEMIDIKIKEPLRSWLSMNIIK